MELECQDDAGSSREPRQTDITRAILVVGAAHQSSDRIKALATELPHVAVIEVENVNAACRPFTPPIGLTLIDSALLPAAETAVVLLRTCHPDANIAVMYPSVAAAQHPVASSHWSKVCRSLLPMDFPLEIWLAVVRLMLSGGEYLPVQTIESSSTQIGPAAQRSFDGPPSDHGHVKLTARELQILDKASQGMQNKLIAAEFSLSEHTVKVHLHNIISKLGVHNRTEAAAKYHQLLDAAQRRQLGTQRVN